MKVPGYRRHNPTHRVVHTPPPGTDLRNVAARARYVGSPNHKDSQSFAGAIPAHRPHASICPRDLANQQNLVRQWLQDAIRRGSCGHHWDGEFPRYVWHREGTVVYEARLTNRAKGEYKGYPLEMDQGVRGLS